MIIIQKTRLLVKDFIDHKRDEFVKKNTIFQKNMIFGVDEKWIALNQVEYNGEEYIALPRNFPLRFLRDYLDEDTIVKDTYEIPFKKIKIKNTSKPRNELQVELLDFLIGRNNYSSVGNKPRRGLFANTGIGKTFLTLKYIAGFGYFTCIFCPDERAIKTWKEEIAKFTDILPEEIAIVKGRDSIAKVIKNKDKYRILLFSNKTASSLVDTNDELLILDLFTKLEVGLKVFDEFHLYLKTIFNMDTLLVTHRTFYLTATNIMRIYGEQKVMNHITPAEDCVYQQEKEEKFNVYAVKYYSNPTDKEHTKGINRMNGLDNNNYLKYILNENLPYSDFYLRKVIRPTYLSAKKKLLDPSHKIAFIFKSKEAGIKVANYLKEEFPDIDIGIFTSDILDMSLREKELDKNVIISTDKSFAGIINIYYLSVIINSTPITAPAHLEQIVGRMRDEPDKNKTFYQLVDLSFSKMKGMLYREKKVLEPLTIEFFEINVNKPALVDIEES